MVAIFAFVDVEPNAVVVFGDESGDFGFFTSFVDDFFGVADPTFGRNICALLGGKTFAW